MKRKHFITQLTGATAAVMLMSNKPAAIAQTQKDASAQPRPDTAAGQTQQEPAPFPTELVKDFVIAGHGDFTKVQQMLQANPNLIYSKHDWGNGDFEAAIEGAGHVGNKEIANYLLSAGSRVTIYVLTMLGKTDLVKPIIETYPALLNAKGPHGFTLLHHAKVGGKDSEELYAWLQQKGLREDWIKLR